MKRIAILCGIIAALLCLTQNASAQYARKGANIVDKNGYVLSDSQLINVAGQDVFDQTVIGARKQYKAGKSLITGGILGIGAGLAGAVLTGVKAGKSGYSDLDTAVQNDASIAAMYLGSTALASLGGTAISGGIILKIIGKKRLDWVSEECNRATLTYHIGATPSGVGLAINF